jgi:alpha-L-rhamnosidase
MLAISHVIDMAYILGIPEDVKSYTTLLDSLKTIYHNFYFNTTSSNYGASQTANILALVLDIPTTDEARQGAIDYIVSTLEDSDYTLGTGTVGVRYVFEALMAIDRWDIAVKIANKTTFPSFGYMMIEVSLKSSNELVGTLLSS